ncbi:MAG: hypothetical protein D6680_05770 [Cyanobacteria bacterium J007]|nr:MAG: hypothetical protein D6680_05770 [Cyanobacteria bacterium J007]
MREHRLPVVARVWEDPHIQAIEEGLNMVLLLGDDGDNFLVGTAQNDTVLGAQGDDVLLGEQGDDFLFGGDGDDTLSGGEGEDLFLIGFGEGQDTIADFELGSDRIALPFGVEVQNLQLVEVFNRDGTPSNLTRIQITTDEGIQVLASVRSLGGSLSLDSSSFVSGVEPIASILDFSAPVSVDEGAGVATVRVTRTGDTSESVSATVRPSNGTAIAPRDFSSSPLTVTFAPGQTEGTVEIPIVDDLAVEGNESFSLSLALDNSQTILGDRDTAEVTILDNDAAIAFASAQYVANESTGNAAITLVREGVATVPVAVTFRASDGTATSPADYSSSPIRVSLAAGETSQTVLIPIADDSSIEGSETVNLLLEDPSPGSLLGSQNTASLRIDDNDSSIQFGEPTFSVTETGEAIAAITITRTGVLDGTVGATVTLADGTATSPEDFDNTPIPVTFNPGEIARIIEIPLVDDGLVENPETIALSLSSPTGGATIGLQNTATVTVIDTDRAIEFAAAEFRVTEGGEAIAPVTLTRLGDLETAVGVTVNLGDGSAIAPADYDNTPITVDFAPGQQSQTIEIPLVDDIAIEGEEALALTLSAPTGGATLGPQSTAQLLVDDNDSGLQFVSSQFSVTEAGEPIQAIAVARSGDLNRAVAATITLADGTAIAPDDYDNTPIAISFAPGQAQQTVTVPIVEDGLAETTETVNLTLSNPVGGTTIGAQNTATLAIVDDEVILDFAAPSFTLTEEGTAIEAVRVIRTGDSDRAVGATVLLGNNTAIAAEDFDNTPIAIDFQPGETEKIVPLPLLDDPFVEGAEVLNLALVNPTNGAAIGSQNGANVTIVDNDSAISFGAPSFTIAEDGSGFAEIELLRNGTLDRGATVAVELADNSAIAPFDYDNTPIPVVFNPGEATATVRIPVADDAIAEVAETLTLSLTNPSPGMAIGPQNVATLTLSRSDLPTRLDFEGPENLDPVSGFYERQGIFFSENALAIVDTDALDALGRPDEFGGNFGGAPSGIAALTYGEGEAIVMNVSGGFDRQLSFFFASPFADHTVTIYDDLGGQGNVLASTSLSRTPQGPLPDAYASFAQVTLPFAGVARSVSFGSQANKLLLDDIVLG